MMVDELFHLDPCPFDWLDSLKLNHVLLQCELLRLGHMLGSMSAKLKGFHRRSSSSIERHENEPGQ